MNVLGSRLSLAFDCSMWLMRLWQCDDLHNQSWFCLLNELKHDWFNTLLSRAHRVLLTACWHAKPTCTILHSIFSNCTIPETCSFTQPILPWPPTDLVACLARHLRPVNCWNYQAWIDRLVRSIRELSLEGTTPTAEAHSETEVMPVAWSENGMQKQVWLWFGVDIL